MEVELEAPVAQKTLPKRAQKKKKKKKQMSSSVHVEFDSADGSIEGVSTSILMKGFNVPVKIDYAEQKRRNTLEEWEVC